MGIIHIDKLKPGMVLDQEVRDINGRLLLKKEKEIQPSHIRIFKIWGVTEVNIRGGNSSKDTSTGPEDPELVDERLAAIKEQVMEAWEALDCCYRLTVEPEVFWRRGGPPDQSAVRIGEGR